jgi:hypothetical protein
LLLAFEQNKPNSTLLSFDALKSAGGDRNLSAFLYETLWQHRTSFVFVVRAPRHTKFQVRQLTIRRRLLTLFCSGGGAL